MSKPIRSQAPEKSIALSIVRRNLGHPTSRLLLVALVAIAITGFTVGFAEWSGSRVVSPEEYEMAVASEDSSGDALVMEDSLQAPVALARAGDEGTVHPLRIMTMNIRHGAVPGGDVDLSQVADYIKSFDPDVVFLQEVDKNLPRSGRQDQAQVLAGLLGFEMAYGPNLRTKGGYYGNAILSRFPISEVENTHLPSLGEPRGMLSATIVTTFDGGTRIRVATTHLGLVSFEKRRQVQALNRELLNYMAQDSREADSGSGPPRGKTLIILAGDFNAVLTGSDVAALRTHLHNAAECADEIIGPDFSFRMVNGKGVLIDQVWLSKAIAVRRFEIPETTPSDHWPLILDLDLGDGSRGAEDGPAINGTPER